MKKNGKNTRSRKLTPGQKPAATIRKRKASVPASARRPSPIFQSGNEKREFVSKEGPPVTPPRPENSTQKVENFTARRHAEIPPYMLEEIGLTIDEIPKGENPWKDPRYVTQVALPNGATGQVFYFKFERINAPNYHNLHIYASGLLKGLDGKPLMSVWTLWEKLLERQMFEENKDEGHRRLMSDHSHMLARVREVVKPLRQRLVELKAEFTGLRELLIARGLGKAFDKAIETLREVEEHTRSTPTVGEFDLFSKRLLRAMWISDRPAIAYAVSSIFRKHSKPPLKVAEICRRMAAFENAFLRANVDRSGGSVNREMSRFKKNPNRVQIMDRLVEEVLTSEWYDWPPGVSCSGDPPNESPGQE